MSPQQLSLHFVSFLILSYFPSPSCCFGKFSGTEASPSETFWGLLFLSQLFGHIFSLYLAVFEFDIENLGVLSGVLLHTVVLIRIWSVASIAAATSVELGRDDASVKKEGREAAPKSKSLGP